ncbi:methyltransferase [Rapidithrix thailandica]|uniref:Methyltransferase n=1 Tax=Rapidithrix thailandica TaxID=413964 RepID=A0AAW9SDG9_9BACT
MDKVFKSPQAPSTVVNADKIFQVATGFFASKTLLTATNLGLFALLAKGPLPAREIQEKLGLHSRGLFDFLDALTSLGFLERSGLKETAIYQNAPDVDTFLNPNNPHQYMGNVLEMVNNRLYPFWNYLEDALKSGKPQNEYRETGKPIFEALVSSPEKLRKFISAMRGAQLGNFHSFVEKFDFSRYKTLCDVGGASGVLAMLVATKHPHMKCTTWDIPEVSQLAREYLREMKMKNKVAVKEGDFFTDSFPNADIIVMGNILHDWDLDQKKALIRKAFNALPKGGAFVVIENILDNERKENTFGLLMSLNMLIECEGGFDFTEAEFKEWTREAGFRYTDLLPLGGPSSAAIAYKLDE